MRHLIKSAAEHPWLVCCLLVVATALAVTQIDRLHIAISAESMLARDTPAWDYFVATEETFGSEDVVIVVLHDPDIFAPDKVAAAHAVVRKLNALPHVSGTSSLFSVPNLRNVDGFIHTRPYLDGSAMTDEQIERLTISATRNPLALGNLISADGRTIAINVFLDRGPEDPDFDRKATRSIERLITPLRDRVADVYQIGVAAMRSDLTDKIRGDQRVFLPLSVLVLLVALAISLRRGTAALMPMVTAGLSVVWTLGFMGWLGIPVNIMTSIVPALVIVIGSTEDIHLLAEYAAGIRAGLPRRSAIAHMADNMGTAVLLTFLTTYVGFLSIALNDIELLYQFGLVASTGLLFNFVVTVTLVPAMLRGFGHRHAGATAGSVGHGWYQDVAAGLLDLVQRRRLTVLAVAAVLAALAAVAATQLRINNNLLDYLDTDSPLRADAERVHRQLSGVHSFSIIVESGIDGTFLQLKYLEELRKLQAFVDSMGSFDRTFSFADFVALVNSVMADDHDHRLRLPESDDIVREYLLFIKRGDIASYVSPSFDRARVLVRHNVASSDDLNRAVRAIREYARANIDPALRVEVTGKSVLSNQAVEDMAHGQLQSLLLVGGVIVAIVSLLFVSLRAGLIALVPNLFPVVVLFGVMGLAGIPLNAGTSMVAAIALGICIDDTMHVMSRFHAELRRHEDRAAALSAMIRAEAIPIFATSIALAAGFAVFATSSFQPVVDFGLLSALVILVALLATFTLTPLLLSSSELLTVWDLLSYRVQNEALRRSPLFQGMYVWQIKKILLASEIRQFPAGATILREGDAGTEVYVVLEGRVEARKQRHGEPIKHLRTMRVGELFGEVGPLSGGQRTADVVALADTQALVLSWDRLDRLTRLFPILAFRLFRNLTRIVGARLRQTSEYAVGDAAAQSRAPSGSGTDVS